MTYLEVVIAFHWSGAFFPSESRKTFPSESRVLIYRARTRAAHGRVMRTHQLQRVLCTPPLLNATMPVKEALAGIDSLRPGEQFSYQALAKKTRLLLIDVDASTPRS